MALADTPRELMALTDAPADAVTPRSAVNRLVPYVPGKPLEETKRELGLTHVIKLASNENALGPSPKAVAAMQSAVAALHLYPDGAAQSLKSALGAFWDVPMDHIALGNGSDEIIHYLGIAYLRPGDNIVQGDPSFVRYEAAAVLNDAECIKVPLRELTHDLDALAGAVTDRTRMVFLANPNNPTSTMNTQAEVDRLLDRLPPHVLLVLDEAYLEYVDDPDFPNSIEYVKQGRSVIVLHTFSKVYGIAGLRVGYGLARPDVIRAVEQVREPFNVNTLAQVGALAALGDNEFVERSRRSNAEGKRTLAAAFDRMGLAYPQTQGNFILVDVGRDARAAYNALLKRGVIVRTDPAWNLPTHLRVTIGTAEENAKFLAELEAVLAE